ncbi:MAG: hypothetical protein WD738_15270 [Pirellulales bacterium]
MPLIELLEQKRLLAADTSTGCPDDSVLQAVVATERIQEPSLSVENIAFQSASTTSETDNDNESESETEEQETSDDVEDDDSDEDTTDEDTEDEEDDMDESDDDTEEDDETDDQDDDMDDEEEDIDDDEEDIDDEEEDEDDDDGTVITASLTPITTGTASGTASLESEMEGSATERGLTIRVMGATAGDHVVAASELSLSRQAVPTSQAVQEPPAQAVDASTVDLLLAVAEDEQSEPESTEFVGQSDQRDALPAAVDLAYASEEEPKASASPGDPS